MKEEVEFLGHIVSGEGVQPNPDNVAKIRGWKVPSNSTEVHQFVGMTSYCRCSIPQFAKVAKPLTDLTKHDQDFHWTLETQEAFDKLKDALTGPNIIQILDGKESNIDYTGR